MFWNKKEPEKEPEIDWRARPIRELIWNMKYTFLQGGEPKTCDYDEHIKLNFLDRIEKLEAEVDKLKGGVYD